MFILTKKPSTATFKILDKLKISDFFETVITRESNTPKNKSDLLRELMKNYKLKSDEVLMVGDSEVDIISAKDNNVSVAILVHGYGNYDRIVKMNPDYIFDNLKEIIKVIY
jgi:phosphoglycolate phosphatase